MSLTSYRAAPPRVIDEPTVDLCHFSGDFPARFFVCPSSGFWPCGRTGLLLPRVICLTDEGLVSKAKGRVLSGLALGMRPLGYVNEKIFVLPFADLAATYSPAS
jgi:hypothetical protein